jgi:hypothetical protein
MLSSLFPANDTMLDRAILDNDTLSDDRCHSSSDGTKDDTRVDELEVA